MIDLAEREERSRAAVAATEGPDLFTLGRQAAARVRDAGGRVVFARARQLLSTGAWRGPRDAADAYVEDEDLAALGGLPAAIGAGVRTVVTSKPAALRDQGDLRVLVRVRFRAGEREDERLARLEEIAALVRGGLRADGVLPTPEGEPLGLDTVRFVALVRLHLPVPHVVVDFARLGHRLAQMCLGFGADELFGPIVPERALRLGDNANNPAMTRKEAATLIRGAGLLPYERGAGGVETEYQYVAPVPVLTGGQP
jgi:hypothetical protein